MGKDVFEKVKKRDGSIVDFDRQRITEAIFSAAKSVGGKDQKLAEELTDRVLKKLRQKIDGQIPEVEAIQDMVEKVLIDEGHAKTAKAFILYRERRSQVRNEVAFLKKADALISSYVLGKDWRVKENANAAYSVSGLQWHISGALIAEYALNFIYPNTIADAHRNGDMHIHDLFLGTFASYCAGWSFRQLLMEGFNGVSGKISARPAKHFGACLGQVVNFFGTLQNEWDGAQAFSSFDTYLAPLAHYDKLSFDQIKQGVQEFMFGINQTSRWGNQVPFTNITLDWTVPEDMAEQNIIRGGKILKDTYADFQDEMDMINKALIEVFMEGDMDGRIFTFPIPTYNITKDFDWKTDNADALFEMTTKYGIPYFQNFVNSSLKPSDVRSMCCRLQLNLKELRHKTGGLFGSGEQTGSIGVVTINMPKIAFLSKTKKEFFDRVTHLMELAKTSLEIKRKEATKNMNQGLLPYTKRYLGTLNNHFSTIGLVGMNEACENFMNTSIASKEGKAFALETLDLMRENLTRFQKETGHIYNLEATPAEGTAYRLARIDKRNHPKIITQGDGAPFYTNSTNLPVDYSKDIFDALLHQDQLQCKYTGGTVLHGFLGESLTSGKECALLVKRIAHRFKLPYYTITPTFSICPEHGYVKGEHFKCPNDLNGGELKK